MPQYQNYQPNVPQYQNQIPFWPQQIQQPVFERMQQNVSPSYQQFLNARIVDNFDNITANDVPMSGGALFLKNDGSEVEYRAWKADGTISKLQYSLCKDDSPSPTQTSSERESLTLDMFNEVSENILQRIDLLSARLEEVTKTKTNTRTKKEALTDE